MKNASKFLRVLPSFGATSKILHKKKCYFLSARRLAGSDLFSAELCSDQRFSTLQMVSPMQVSPQLHLYLYKFCMTDVNYDLLMEKVILLSSLTILKEHHICHL